MVTAATLLLKQDTQVHDWTSKETSLEGRARLSSWLFSLLRCKMSLILPKRLYSVTTEKQHISENNINTTLAALTMQLQQLTQLVANPTLPAVLNTSSLPVPSPPTSLFSTPMALQTYPKLSSPPDFSRERHNSRTFLNFYFFYIRLALEQFYNKQEKILWALTFFKGGHATKWSENVFCQEMDTGVFPMQT